MIDDRGIPTLWVYGSGDELHEGDVASSGGVMKGTSSTFIFLTQDLWALLHQVFQESQVTPLSQLDGNRESEDKRRFHLSVPDFTTVRIDSRLNTAVTIL